MKRVCIDWGGGHNLASLLASIGMDDDGDDGASLYGHPYSKAFKLPFLPEPASVFLAQASWLPSHLFLRDLQESHRRPTGLWSAFSAAPSGMPAASIGEIHAPVSLLASIGTDDQSRRRYIQGNLHPAGLSGAMCSEAYSGQDMCGRACVLHQLPSGPRGRAPHRPVQ